MVTFHRHKGTDSQKIDHNDLLNKPDSGFSSKARAYLNVAQTISDNSWTKITLDTENYDGNDEFASNKFTAKEAGYYQVNAQIMWNSSVDQSLHAIGLYKNGSRIAQDWKNSSGIALFGQGISDIVYLAVGDYLELYVYQNIGANKNVEGNSDTTYMSIHRLS